MKKNIRPAIPDQPWSLAFVFRDFHLDRPNAHPLALAVATAMVQDELGRDELDAIARDHGIVEVEGVAPVLLDLVLYYIRFALIDHLLSTEEIEIIQYLKRLFRVAEGDFWRLRRREIGEIVSLEMERILADGKIDFDEELHQVEVQALFDLSYDQYLDLTKGEVERLVAGVLDAITIDDEIGAVERHELHASISELLPVFHLQQLIEKDDIQQYLPSRVITQRVKDEVWRRDGGRCVTCGSQNNLEFDHIIPFAKGGASTYRNVQLLCQTCNRRKSASIG